MTRVATAENEEQLVVLATHSTAAQLEKMCRLYRGVQMLDREAEEVETWERYLQSRDTEGGMVTITLKMLPDEADRFVKAAETCAGGQQLVDGAVHMAELALSHHIQHWVDAERPTFKTRYPSADATIALSTSGTILSRGWRMPGFLSAPMASAFPRRRPGRKSAR